jgi:hypothetical protein
MSDKSKGKAKQTPSRRRALSVLEKHLICKKRQEFPKETLAIFATRFPDSNGEPLKPSTLSDVLKDSTKWLAVDGSSTG